MKIAIQGHEGSFHSIAAKRLFGEQTVLIYCDTFKQAFLALENGKADQAVVAIENSLYGSLNDTYDLLLTHNFTITAEVYEQVNFYLFGTTASSLHSITDVYSQAPGLGECEEFLDSQLPSATRHEYFDTAAAAEHVAKSNNPHFAAIASKRAGLNRGLKIIAENIETHHHNYTRFIALSKEPGYAEDSNKTSITFRTADKAGSLHGALGVFAARDINLTKLESRPIVGEAWQYMYYVDFSASMNNGDAIHALKELEAHATSIRILGSYKSGELFTA